MTHPWRSFALAGLLALLVTFVLFAPSALAAPPEEDIRPQPDTGYACDGSDGVYLYEDINYGADCIRFTGDDPELGNDGWHDRASSVKFVGFMYAGGRARATLCTDAYYGGACLDFGTDIPWLGDQPIGNDSADSIRVQIRPFCDMVTQIPKSECEALVALYNSTFGPYWYNRTGWLANYTPCSWYGVACEGGRVTGLTLSSNNLAGGLPTSLGNLANLRVLYLSANHLTGAIPTTLGSLPKLKSLGLGGNGLTGGIPSALGNLSSLEYLNLVQNDLTGGIPASLGNLSNLTALWLYSNHLTGGIPTELGSLSNLQTLYLGENQLNGSLPSTLGSLSNLVELRLHNNQFTGSIPSTFGSLSHLKMLYLYDNHLNGSIPTNLGSLSNLYELRLDDNDLTGSIPSTLGNISSLVRLRLEGNQLTGGVPTSLGSLPLLVVLHVNNNPLSGSLPQSLKNLALERFWFDSTNLCEPRDAAFQAWLASVQDLKRTNVKCSAASATPTRTATRTAQKRLRLPIVTKQRVAPGPTSTPTHTATRTPTRTPTPGALVFSDDFNDGKLAGWTAQGGTWANPNTYMRGASNGTYAWNMRAETGANVVLEGTVNLLSGKGAGIIARASADGTESYFVFLNAQRNAFEFCLNHEGWIFGSYPMTVQYNHPYHLKVVLNGNYLEGYLDGVRRMYGTYDLHSSGQFGTFIWDGEAAFDNVKAWSIP